MVGTFIPWMLPSVALCTGLGEQICLMLQSCWLISKSPCGHAGTLCVCVCVCIWLGGSTQLFIITIPKPWYTLVHHLYLSLLSYLTYRNCWEIRCWSWRVTTGWISTVLYRWLIRYPINILFILDRSITIETSTLIRCGHSVKMNACLTFGLCTLQTMLRNYLMLCVNIRAGNLVTMRVSVFRS